jgi:hypothetical protein
MTTLDSSALNSWGGWADVGCVLVIIGIVGEGAELIVKWGEKECFRKWFEYRLNPNILSSFVKFVGPIILPVETIFAFMVILGLSIEFLGTHKANGILYRNNNELLAKNNALEGVLRPRILQFDSSAFCNSLKGKPKVSVEILYPKDDVEAYDFADKIMLDLISLGWRVSFPRPIIQDDLPDPLSRKFGSNMPLVTRMNVSWGGFGIIAGNMAVDMASPGPVPDFGIAFSEGFGGGRYGSSLIFSTNDPRIPDNSIKLIIGPAYNGVNWENGRMER